MTTASVSAFPAILLIGATGSGKTPFGDLLDRDGLWGHACHHFDFGSQMRAIVTSSDAESVLHAKDLRVIRDALDSGALLQDDQFHVALALFEFFVRERKIAPDDFVVLNGLPRHKGQADAMRNAVGVRLVLHLACSPQVVYERIRSDSGGDRTGRRDNGIEAVRTRISIFEEQTLPLLEYYRNLGTPIADFKTGVETTAEELRDLIENMNVDNVV